MSSGYSILSFSRNKVQDPALYSSKLDHWLAISIIPRKFLSVFDCPSHLGALGLRGVGIFVLEGILSGFSCNIGGCVAAGVEVSEIVNEVKKLLWILKGLGSRMALTKASSEITGDAVSLNCPGMIGPDKSAVVSRNRFGSLSDEEPSVGTVKSKVSDNSLNLECLLAAVVCLLHNNCSGL